MSAVAKNGSAGVIFDLDETLLDRTASISAYGCELYSRFERYVPDTLEDFLVRFHEFDGNGYIARESFFASLAEYLGAPGVDASVIANHFDENAWAKPLLMSGAVEMLRTLRDAGMSIGIVTNGGSRNQRKKLANTGLDRLVDGCIVSEEFGAKKPDPAIFLAACEMLRLDPGAAWFVGDNPELDIIGAHRVGLRTIWMKRSIPWPEAAVRCYVCEVNSLEEVLGEIMRDVRAGPYRV
jgi:putative hydrolase of the HAD superfamily